MGNREEGGGERDDKAETFQGRTCPVEVGRSAVGRENQSDGKPEPQTAMT
jgi:hypothetical protein